MPPRTSPAIGAKSWWASGSPPCSTTTTSRGRWALPAGALRRNGLVRVAVLSQGRRGPHHLDHVLDAAEGRGSIVPHPRRHRPEDVAGAAHSVRKDVRDRTAGFGRRT